MADFGYAARMTAPACCYRYSLISLLLLVSACASPLKSVLPANELWESRQVQLADIRHWRLRARIGIVSEQESGAADLQWEQDGNSFSLKVTAAFGRSLIAIEGAEGSVTMRNAQGEVLNAGSAEDLIRQQTGWIIPVNGLRHWILGLPAGLYGDESYSLDNAGRLEKLQAGGWQVEYQRYHVYGEHQLPDKIRMQNAQVKIKLAIIDWKILAQ